MSSAETATLSPPPGKLPEHIAIIMDGNGRWAGTRGLARSAGHRAGAAALRQVMQACRDWGIGYLTVYAFSTENWQRPANEVQTLLALLAEYFQAETANLLTQGVRLHLIGDWQAMPQATAQTLRQAKAALSAGDKFTLAVALNYGGRDEIIRAAQALAHCVAAGELPPEAITAEEFAAQLDTAGLPDPDLLIRTAGEQRLSNFLLWQLSYAEFYFTEICWPDFDREALRAAIQVYQERQRNFGALPPAAKA